MSRKPYYRDPDDDAAMTPTQKQAIVVCVLCMLAILVTAFVTKTLIERHVAAGAADDPSSVVEPVADSYQIDPNSPALLQLGQDAGEEYLADTLFIGDSNTVRYYNSGLIGLQQYCAREGLTTEAAMTEPFVVFANDSQLYTVPQAVAMLKPRRVVIMLGTNDTALETAQFTAAYSALLAAIQASYPYTDIIVNTIPPVPQSSPDAEARQQKIDQMNMALLSVCEQAGVAFLNSAEALRGEDGYGIADYYVDGDIHLISRGLRVVLSYLQTHPLLTEDRRPDTDNIPARAQEYTNAPATAVPVTDPTPTPTPEATATPTATPEAVRYQASYQVDRGAGGTLSCGNDTGRTSLSYTVTDAAASLTVTATPASGYIFVGWSDGVTTRTRTDTNFRQNVNVTAQFATASVTITGSGSTAVGGTYTVKAQLSGRQLSASDLRWYINGSEVSAAAGSTQVDIPIEAAYAGSSYEITAVVTAGDNRVTSNALRVTVPAVQATATPSATPAPTADWESPFIEASPSPSPSASPSAAPSAAPSPSPSAQPTTTPQPTDTSGDDAWFDPGI